MSDKDSIIHKYQNKLDSNLAERSLISLERSQKLDLLIHLLANLRKVLIVCGPKGIGKSTLLESLQNCRKDLWDICRLSGTSAFNYETIIIDLCRFLNLRDTRNRFDIPALSAYCEHQKVILVIDDAGELAPGLIDTLVGLSESISGLRLVFAMTYDEFHIKVVTDKTLEDSHSIELPALTEKQCGEYLQNLSAQPGAFLAYKEVTDSLVTALYRETHGIPGRILAEIPKLHQYQKKSKSRLVLWLSVAFIVVITAWFVKTLTPSSIFSDKKLQLVEEEQQITTPINLPPPLSSELVKVEKPAAPKLVKEPDSEQNQVLPIKPKEEESDIVISPSEPPAAVSKELTAKNTRAAPPNTIAAEPATKPEVSAMLPPQTEAPPEQAIKNTHDFKAETATGVDDNLAWILAQPSENYTLQVMVLSTKAAAQRFLKKYPDYSDRLKYYVINKNTQQKFVLIYGSFATSADAKISKAALPAEFNHSLEKRFKLIQNESRR